MRVGGSSTILAARAISSTSRKRGVLRAPILRRFRTARGSGGREQLGTLGSGNHFLEVGYVTEVYDEEAAQALGLAFNQITVIIHCGSRGFGYQICSDYLDVMDRAVKKYGIALPDRQLACAPVNSPEGQNYLGAMRCAINYAFANRQVIAHRTRKAFEKALGMSAADTRLRTIYEVAHNIAKFETRTVEGSEMRLCVHRKGATRAFAPRCKEIPSEYQAVGQPVLIPRDMVVTHRCSPAPQKRCKRHSAAPATVHAAR
jgi:tRNA-splicing ligase RtcB (3'-phosphate/5'-hydroxy nucleic acid ligase)